MSYRRNSRRNPSGNPIPFFILIACFGILFVGCSSSQQITPEFEAFTEADLERAQQLKNQEAVELQVHASGTIIPTLVGTGAQAQPLQDAKDIYAELRGGQSDNFVVSNAYVNVRRQPSVTAAIAERLERGDIVHVQEFIDNAWAKITTNDGDAYVSKRYIAKQIAEKDLELDQKQYDGLYFVDFDFLNVRRSPDTTAEKVGTLPGQAIINPVSMDDVWARITINGTEGYVAREYLTPFLPNYSVRQSKYTLPIVEYDASTVEVSQLLQVIDGVKSAGKSFITLRDFRSVLQDQQTNNVRLPPNQVVLILTNITPDTINEVSDAIYASGIQATAFIRSTDISIEGITERKITNIQANGLDVQSAAHTGDDLRSLTNAQIQLELQQSKQILSDVTGKDVFALYYPAGATNDRIADFAKYTGYLFGVTAMDGQEFSRADLLNLPRISIESGAPVDALLELFDA